jgi:glycosyltransferase involved in cell wall biosynthesis
VLECSIAESKLRQLVADPVLSIVIPTYQRSEELALAVSSIAEQLTGGLEQKVEIILTDNCSGLETVSRIKHMAAQYSTVSYLLHSRDEGGFFQFFAAPWRARGRYTWVFGSDDVLLQGAVAHVLEMLERETPNFATLNKKVFDRHLSEEILGAANLVPDRRFERFEDLMCAFGMGQLGFITSNIELTEAARTLDPAPYLTVDTRDRHVAALLQRHHGKPAYYSSTPHLIYRAANGVGREYLIDNVFDDAVTLPVLLDSILRTIGAPRDFFERMTGDKRIETYDAEDGPTFVDNIFENLLHTMVSGHYFTVSQRWALEGILAGCAPHRLRQLAEIWQMQSDFQMLEGHAQEARAIVEQGKLNLLQAAQTYTRQPIQP